MECLLLLFAVHTLLFTMYSYTYGFHSYSHVLSNYIHFNLDDLLSNQCLHCTKRLRRTTHQSPLLTGVEQELQESMAHGTTKGVLSIGQHPSLSISFYNHVVVQLYTVLFLRLCCNIGIHYYYCMPINITNRLYTLDVYTCTTFNIYSLDLTETDTAWNVWHQMGTPSIAPPRPSEWSLKLAATNQNWLIKRSWTLPIAKLQGKSAQIYILNMSRDLVQHPLVTLVVFSTWMPSTTCEQTLPGNWSGLLHGLDMDLHKYFYSTVNFASYK